MENIGRGVFVCVCVCVCVCRGGGGGGNKVYVKMVDGWK